MGSGLILEPMYSIRPVSSDDISKILAIENQVHLAPWTREHFEKELGKSYSHFLVLTDDDTDEIVVGFLVFWVLGEEVEVHDVAVSLDFQRQGFGEKLLRAAINEGQRQGAKKVFLYVRKSNLPAISMYQKIGFEICKIRKNFYTNGEDAYHMEINAENDLRLSDFDK